jgi:hypothetical protein
VAVDADQDDARPHQGQGKGRERGRLIGAGVRQLSGGGVHLGRVLDLGAGIRPRTVPTRTGSWTISAYGQIAASRRMYARLLRESPVIKADPGPAPGWQAAVDPRLSVPVPAACGGRTGQLASPAALLRSLHAPGGEPGSAADRHGVLSHAGGTEDACASPGRRDADHTGLHLLDV